MNYRPHTPTNHLDKRTNHVCRQANHHAAWSPPDRHSLGPSIVNGPSHEADRSVMTTMLEPS